MVNKRRVHKCATVRQVARLLPGGDGCLAPSLTLSHGHKLPTLPLRAGVRHLNSHGNFGKHQSRIETLELKNHLQVSLLLKKGLNKLPWNGSAYKVSSVA